MPIIGAIALSVHLYSETAASCNHPSAESPENSVVTILKSKSKIAIFCQNRPKSKSLHLLSHVSLSSCFDFLQQLINYGDLPLRSYSLNLIVICICVIRSHVHVQTLTRLACLPLSPQLLSVRACTTLILIM